MSFIAETGSETGFHSSVKMNMSSSRVMRSHHLFTKYRNGGQIRCGCASNVFDDVWASLIPSERSMFRKVFSL